MNLYEANIKLMMEGETELDIHKFLAFLLDNRRIIAPIVMDINEVIKPEATRRGLQKQRKSEIRDSKAIGNED